MYVSSTMHVLVSIETCSVEIPQQPKRIRTAFKTESDAFSQVMSIGNMNAKIAFQSFRKKNLARSLDGQINQGVLSFVCTSSPSAVKLSPFFLTLSRSLTV